jgi:transcriptional regulator with XRE-family HTH domain
MSRASKKDNANEIKLLRLKKGLTQREMAAICGVELRTYQRWEEKPMSKKTSAIVALLAAAG